MAREKAIATRTLNPLHFEDLEPHRFEDLVRRLLYGFRDWIDIEPTGRAGSDEGFDVRCWERGETVTNVGEEGEEATRTQERRLWQIQGKREKSITPARMRTLIDEGVDGASPPYGYILAAAANISKAAYDTYRDALRAKGVTEFYFWGKDYLEDQLALPQNDEILFTFFGISLSPRRRSRVSEIKFGINNKNKILRIAFGGETPHEGVISHGRTFLLRDVKDAHYPWKSLYPDFDAKPRWESHEAVKVTARSIIFTVRERYASYDATKRTWDFTKAVDLIQRRNDDEDPEVAARLRESALFVERFWRHLPRRHQAKLVVYGIVNFDDILIIDDKGDPEHTDPHLFIDFGQDGPFGQSFANLFWNHQVLDESEFANLKRGKIFPSQFPPPPEEVRIHEWSALGLAGHQPRFTTSLYGFDGNLDALREGDVIQLPKTDRGGDEYREVTHAYTTTVGAEVAAQGSDHCKGAMKKFASREVADDERVRVYELARVIRPYGEGGPVIYLSDSF